MSPVPFAALSLKRDKVCFSGRFEAGLNHESASGSFSFNGFPESICIYPIDFSDFPHPKG